MSRQIDVLQEVTEWDWPNHTYHVDQKAGKIIGYVKASATDLITFKNPLGFNKARRKFKKLRSYEL